MIAWQCWRRNHHQQHEWAQEGIIHWCAGVGPLKPDEARVPRKAGNGVVQETEGGTNEERATQA